MDSQLLAALAGAAAVFLGGHLKDHLRRRRERRERRERARSLLHLICGEIDRGIERCEGMERLYRANQFSYGFLVTSTWKNYGPLIVADVEDAEVLDLIGQIYGIFDQVRLNSDRGALGPATAFATEKLGDLYTGRNALHQRIGQLRATSRSRWSVRVRAWLERHRDSLARICRTLPRP